MCSEISAFGVKKVSVIIINYNTSEMTKKVISRLLELEGKIDFEVILIDNNSQEELILDKTNSVDILIKNKKNLGFAAAVNQGIAKANNENILLLNSDVLIEAESISKLLVYLDQNKKIMIVGPQMIYPDGRFQSSFGPFPSLRSELLRFSLLYKIFPGGSFSINTIFKKIKLNKAYQVDWLSGGCLLFKKKLTEEIGTMNEKYFFGVEDIDFCLAAKNAGYKTIYCPDSRVVHYHGFSSGSDGARSVARIINDRDGLDYFFRKNFSDKKITRVIVGFLHNLKIIYIKILNSIKRVVNNIKYMRSKKNIASDATIAITYKCNSKCQMCNIWQIEEPAELPLEAFQNLSKELKYLNLSGGEPFLRADLPEIVKVINKTSPKAKIIISSNGLATELIIKTMRQIHEIDSRVGIRISLDGIATMHDEVRGIPGIYDAVMATIKGLQKIGIANLGFSFTIMDKNVQHLKKVYNLSKEMNVELALAVVQNSDIVTPKNPPFSNPGLLNVNSFSLL